MRPTAQLLLFASVLLLATACDGFGTGMPDLSTLDAPVDAPTWDEHIGLMVDVHCVECHGETPAFGAPSNVHLETYEGAIEVAEASWHRMIETPTRPMPTLDRPEMSEAELITFENWLNTGMPRSPETGT